MPCAEHLGTGLRRTCHRHAADGLRQLDVLDLAMTVHHCSGRETIYCSRVTDAAWSGNPAHQLHAVLESARTRAAAENQPSLQGWRYALGLSPEESTDTIIRGLLGLGELGRDTRRLVEASGSALADLALERFQEVEAVLSRTWTLTQDMTWSLSGLTDAGMYSLRFCERLIEQDHLVGPTVPSDRLDGLRDLVEQLRAEVMGSDSLQPRERLELEALIDEITVVISTAAASTPETLRRIGNKLVGYLLGRPSANEHLRGTRLGTLLVVTVVAIRGITGFAADVHEVFSEPAITQIQENFEIHVTVDQVEVLAARAITQGEAPQSTSGVDSEADH
jgi:hypothetical protein